MSAERAFGEFVSAWEGGARPDPAAAVAAAAEGEREALAVMLAAYLSAHPRTDVTEAEVAARATAAESDPPRAWDELLPALRARSGTTRGALVTRLAGALGFPQAGAQVEEHVHHLETGQLDPRRVRPAVVAALARILGVSEAVLEAGRRVQPASGGAPVAVFQRAAPLAPAEALAAPPTAAPEPARIAEVDDLFTGDR
jgi:hypothetical protein